MSNSNTIPTRLDCPTGRLHGFLISVASRLIYEFLCREYPTHPLGDVATIHSGGTPSKANPAYWGGDIPWVAPRDMKTFQLGVTNSMLQQEAIEDGAIELHSAPATLLVTRGMILSRYVPVTHASETFTNNQDTRVIKTVDQSVDGLYLSSMLLGAERALYSRVTDSTAGQRRIETPNLASVQIPVPSNDVQIAAAEFTLRMTQSLTEFRDSLEDARVLLPDPIRMIKWIDEVATRVEEAQSNTEVIATQLDRLLMSAFHQIADDAPRRPLKEVAPLTRRPTTIDPTAEYPGISTRSFGRGTFHNPPLLGSEITWQKPYEVKAGDILISNIKAWEGAIAVVTPEDDGRFGSHRYLTFVPKEGLATSRFVCFYLLSPDGLYNVGEASPGSADRNRTTSSRAMEKIPVPVPPYERQVWFDEVHAKVYEAKHLIAANRKEGEALLPSVLNQVFNGGD